MRLDLELYRRDFGSPVVVPDVEIHVDRFSWEAMGGPSDAAATVYGEERQLWELMELLRSPAWIREPYGEPVWWGYLHEVTVRVGAIQVGVSLDGMYNRISVAYGQLDATESGPGDRATTSWAQNDDSAGTYGTKELLASLSQATAISAAQHRDSLLERYKYPTPVHRVNAQGSELSASLRFLGWWHTLCWQYYANAGTSEVATTSQIATIVSGKAQFLQGTEIMNASGVNTNENRSGDEPAGEIIEDLARIGTTNDRRLLATVTRDRYLRLEEEPVLDRAQVKHYMDSNGQVWGEWGSDWLPITNPVGEWIALRDVIPATLDANQLADPTHFFTERATYDAERSMWIPEPRGLPSTWDLAAMLEG